MGLDPGVALGGLPALVLQVEIAAHVATGNAPQPEQAEHQVGEVLADSAPLIEDVLERGAVVRHSRPVLEAVQQEVSDSGDLLPHRLARGDGELCGQALQVGAAHHRTAPVGEIEERAELRARTGRLPQPVEGHGHRVGRDHRARQHLDAIVVVGDPEVVDEVPVPVRVAGHLGGRSHGQVEAPQGLPRVGQGLDPQLQEGLADEVLVVEAELVFDLDQHPDSGLAGEVVALDRVVKAPDLRQHLVAEGPQVRLLQDLHVVVLDPRQQRAGDARSVGSSPRRWAGTGRSRASAPGRSGPSGAPPGRRAGTGPRGPGPPASPSCAGSSPGRRRPAAGPSSARSRAGDRPRRRCADRGAWRAAPAGCAGCAPWPRPAS